MKYTHRQSRRAKRLSITVEPPGKVVVVSPPRVSQQKIDQFFQKHQNWAQTKLEKMNRIKREIESTEQILIFGRHYQKKMINSSRYPYGVFVQGEQLIINHPLANTNSSNLSVKKAKERFLKKTAAAYFKRRLPVLAKQMGVAYGRIKVRNQKTRWGSCSSGSQLNLNWRLVHWPQPIIDYLLVHELAHLKHPNHSPQFWQLVAEHDPDYQDHRRFLKKHALPLL